MGIYAERTDSREHLQAIAKRALLLGPKGLRRLEEMVLNLVVQGVDMETLERL